MCVVLLLSVSNLFILIPRQVKAVRAEHGKKNFGPVAVDEVAP